MIDNYCQSCGIPLGFEEERYGSNQDNSPNHDYCLDCFKEGKFTSNLSFDQMMRISLIYLTEVHPELNQDEAKKQLETTMSQLKRWKNRVI